MVNDDEQIATKQKNILQQLDDLPKANEFGLPFDMDEFNKKFEPLCDKILTKLGWLPAYTKEELQDAGVYVELNKFKNKLLKLAGKQFQVQLRELFGDLQDKLYIKLAKGRPEGRDEKKSKRDAEIRAKYNLLLSQGFTHEHIRKTLSAEYPEVDDIKQIYYSPKP